MKVTILEHIKESLKKIKEDTTNKISELATQTVEAMEELENQKADTSHKHSAGDINSGTLPVARGGTGQTTAAGIRNVLGLGNTTGALPIANGGTGATTAATALSNLGGFPSAGGTITGNTTMNGNLTLKGSGNYGNKINFGDSDYVHISEPTDDNMEIKAKNVNFVVSGNITQNGEKIGGLVTKAAINEAITTGTESTSLGTDTFSQNPKGYGNTAFGSRALYVVSTGEHNTAVGQRALCSNKIGSYNTAIGEGALMSGNASTLYQNTAVGYYALKDTTGMNNVAIGCDALTSNTTGTDNVAIGVGALFSSTIGECNTAVGRTALSGIPTGLSYYNCTGLGYNSQVTGSNQVQLGDTAVTVYAQKALVTRSDARDKIDIEDSPLGLNFILKLRPRKYRMNSREAYFEEGKERDFTAPNDGNKAGKRPHYGLVAQEVKEVMNELGVDFAGYLDSKIDGGEDVLSLGYTEFIAPMIKAIQQQQQMIEQLQKEVEALRS